jgi:hypothetical protein
MDQLIIDIRRDRDMNIVQKNIAINMVGRINSTITLLYGVS